ncbi:MAG: ssuA 6 [Firmicutes bacterium]|nr:ssuA 6 [Bacillota bacterium]
MLENIVARLRKKEIIRSVVAFVMLSIVSLAFAGCSSNDKVTSSQQNAKDSSSAKQGERILKIGSPSSGSPFPGDLLGIALEKGFLHEELAKIGVKEEHIPFTGQGPAVNEALASKNIDIAVYADMPAMIAKSRGLDISVVAANNTAFAIGIIVKKDSPINSIQDLKGKKIAVAKGAIAHRFLIEALKGNNLSVNDVQIVNMTTDAESALISGDVDAWVGTGTMVALLTIDKKITKIIAESKSHTDWAGLFITVARTDYAKENADIISAYIKSLIRAKDFIKQNKDEAYGIWTKASITVESAKYINDRDDLFEVSITDQSISKLNDTKKFLLNEKLIQKDFDTATWIDKKFYEQAIR